MYERWKCLQYIQNVQGTTATRGHGGWSALIANPLKGNTVEIACLDVVLRDRLDRIMPNDGDVYNDTVRVPGFALHQFAKRDEPSHSELHFDKPFSPTPHYIYTMFVAENLPHFEHSTLTQKQCNRSRPQTMVVPRICFEPKECRSLMRLTVMKSISRWGKFRSEKRLKSRQENPKVTCPWKRTRGRNTWHTHTSFFFAVCDGS